MAVQDVNIITFIMVHFTSVAHGCECDCTALNIQGEQEEIHATGGGEALTSARERHTTGNHCD